MNPKFDLYATKKLLLTRQVKYDTKYNHHDIYDIFQLLK